MRGNSRLNVTVHWDTSFEVSQGVCPLFISVQLQWRRVILTLIRINGKELYIKV